jgi:hypothetical protein
MKRSGYRFWFGTNTHFIGLLAIVAMACSSEVAPKPSSLPHHAWSPANGASFQYFGDGAGDCTPGADVTVAFAIFGGAKGNQATITARCGDQVVATCTVVDAGGGSSFNDCTRTAQQMKGTASCEKKYGGAAGGGPASSWGGNCIFR